MVKLPIDKTKDCGSFEGFRDRASAKDIQQARSVDPENTRKLFALVRKDSEPPYCRNLCGFPAILRGNKQSVLLAPRSLWKGPPPPPAPARFIPSASGVAVIYQIVAA